MRKYAGIIFGVVACFAIVGSVQAAIPLEINHQGLVKVSGIPFDGTGEFRFALVDGDTGNNLWTNDGSNVGNSTVPTNGVSISVSGGVYSVSLGNTSAPNMVSLPSTAFDSANVSLRVWFDDRVHGLSLLTPDVKVVSAGYSFHALKSDDSDTLDSYHAADIIQGANASSIPQGVIVMWSGTIANIPAGWALCDGSNGTPDLRDRFIVGAKQDDAGVAKTNVKGSLMSTGGEHQHTLTIPEMPSHNHSYQHHPHWYFSGDSEGAGKGDLRDYTTGNAGGDQPHENCPPFYALAFIQKM